MVGVQRLEDWVPHNDNDDTRMTALGRPAFSGQFCALCQTEVTLVGGCDLLRLQMIFVESKIQQDNKKKHQLTEYVRTVSQFRALQQTFCTVSSL